MTYPAADAAVSGTLGTTAYDHLNLTKGTGSFEQTISEVGAFEFTITPPETYLGSKSFAITSAKEVIGRFYPKYFRIDEVRIINGPILMGKVLPTWSRLLVQKSFT